MKDLYLNALQSQKESFFLPESLVERDIFETLKKSIVKDKRIHIITGLRRAGKSTLLKQLFHTLPNYIFINFDDERFFGFRAIDFESLNEAAITVYQESEYYFFDEIQNVDGWELFVRRLHDEGKKIIISGSNASLLSREYGTKLTGRYKMFELYPYSFPEFLRFKKVSIEPSSLFSTRKKVELKKCFKEWLDLGGIPEYLENKDTEYVKTLFENILYRDIVARYGIKRIYQLKELIHLMVSNLTLPVTYNSLKNTLKLSSADTVREYMDYLNQSWLFFELHCYFPSLKQQLRNPRKIYIIDIGFNRLAGFNTSENLGRRLENIVYIQLRKLSQEVYYYKSENECDFVIKTSGGQILLYQVCYVLNPDNEKREINGLLSAMKYFNTKNGLILTNDQEFEQKYDSYKIRILPVWKWLLERPQ